MKESLRSRSRIEKLLWILVLLFVFAISFSIAITHTILALCAAVYLYWKFRYDSKFPAAPLLLPAAAFMYGVLLSAIFSIHPSVSLISAKELALFVIIPIVYDCVRNLDDIKVIYGVLILAGVISAIYGLYQYFFLDMDRIKGFMGHYMTFSGLLMILNVLLFSQLLFAPRNPFWFYPAFGILSFVLLISLTRNAWLGFVAASFVLVAMRKARLVVGIPVVALLVFVASVLVQPHLLGNRIKSVFSLEETTNRGRLQMWKSGWEIIQDYPLTGVGSGMIERVYPRYRPPDGLFEAPYSHLHNNIVQLAAENGFLTLFAWFWLIGKVLFDLWHWKKNTMSDQEKFMVHGTIGIVVSLFTAGMFEYNFGDSEIKMLFLVLITLPYAWHRQSIVLNPSTSGHHVALRSGRNIPLAEKL